MRKSEHDVASTIAMTLNERLKKEFPHLSLHAKTDIKLTYANEVIAYAPGEKIECEQMRFETDILIYEDLNNGRWKPRVVIETKIRGVTTHDAITYSQKAANHKAVHPYLRYGIGIGKIDQLPGRLFRHGENFDFMISWVDFDPNGDELDGLTAVVKQEVEASRQLEEIMYGTRNKDRAKYFILHRPLVLHRKNEPINI